MSRRLISLPVAFGALVLSGCALTERIQQVAVTAEQAQQELTAAQSAFARAGSREARQAAQKVDKPWLVGRSEPLAREVAVPLALRKNVNTTLVFSGPALGLADIAQRIMQATGIPVHVRAEALLPPERFLPRLGGAGAASAAQAPLTMRLSGEPGPLAGILDRIAARLGVMWRYADDRIEFYRTETRVFSVRALTLHATAEATLGSQRGNSQGDGFSSTSRTRLSGDSASVLEVVRKRIEPFLSQAGVLVAEPGASSSVVVTDTPDVLKRIAAYLDKENQALTRRVRLVFEELTLATNEGAEASIDWNVLFSSTQLAAAALVPGANIEQAASLGLGIRQGPFKGSEALIRALGQVGKVVRRSSVPVLALNRTPVSHAVRTTFSYIDKVQATALGENSSNVLPTVSVSQKEETVGSLLTVVPDAQEDGQILLSVAYDNTVAQPLKSVTFGDKANPLQLQQITIDGNGTVQQVALQPGQPFVIAGFNRLQDEHQGRRINPGLPMALGGAERVVSQQLTTIMVLTAQVEEGF